MEPQENGARFAVWSTFRELLGWNDDAGPMPKSIGLFGWILTVTLLIFGVVAVFTLNRTVLGLISAVIGIGLAYGTFELS